MTFWIYLYVVIFWAMQIVAQLFFKWGSTSETRWLWGFFGGNMFGFSSIWLLMLLYKAIHPNVAMAISMGGAFFLTQLFLAFVFKSEVTLIQWFGVLAIMVGMVVLAVGKT